MRPEDAVARAWDPLFEAIARGDRAALQRGYHIKMRVAHTVVDR